MKMKISLFVLLSILSPLFFFTFLFIFWNRKLTVYKTASSIFSVILSSIITIFLSYSYSFFFSFCCTTFSLLWYPHFLQTKHFSASSPMTSPWMTWQCEQTSAYWGFSTLTNFIERVFSNIPNDWMIELKMALKIPVEERERDEKMIKNDIFVMLFCL